MMTQWLFGFRSQTWMVKKLIGLMLLTAGWGASAQPASNDWVAHSLNGLLFVFSADQIQPQGIRFEKPEVRVSENGFSQLQGKEFSSAFEKFLGREFHVSDLNELTAIARDFLVHHDLQFAHLVVPEQNMDTGVLQILISPFKIESIQLSGNSVFSDELLLKRSGLKPGDSLSISHVGQALQALNDNPSRSVEMVLKPGSKEGTSEVDLLVKEEKPWTVNLTQDNAGAAKLGALQRGFGLSHGNLFGLDQQASMQYTCSYASSSCSLGLNWSTPVSTSRLDKVTLSVLQAQQQPISNSGFVSYVGHSSQFSLKYVNVHPIQAQGDMSSSLEWSLGVDNKSTNNNFEFAGIFSAWNFSSVPATVLQFPLTLNFIQTDENGQTRINEQLVHSPGGLISHNDSNTFNNYVDQASARYTYWRQELSRTQKVFSNWMFSSKLLTQWSNQNLLYSERLVLGGPGSLRSYQTASATGSTGLVFSQELRSPNFSIWPGGAVKDLSQWGLFWDVAKVQQVLPTSGDYQSVSLAGAGVLLETSLDRHWKMVTSAGRQFKVSPGTTPALGTTLNFSLSAMF